MIPVLHWFRLRVSADLESTPGFGDVRALRRLVQTAACSLHALHCTDAVYWKPAPRYLHQVSPLCERDIIQRRAAETCPFPVTGARGAATLAAAKVADRSGVLLRVQQTPPRAPTLDCCTF